MTLKPPEETVVRTAADLTRLWTDMMGPGGFGRRSLWHVFLAADGQLTPAVLPIDDVPLEPDDRLVANLGYVVREVLADAPGGTVAALLSRPGPGQMTAADRRWARAVRDAYGADLSPWPVHLATRDRVRVFAPDDLIAA